jgi:osmotically-inducible protein OsmY
MSTGCRSSRPGGWWGSSPERISSVRSDASDEEIEREISDDVLLHTLWVDPEAVSLVVIEGQVRVAGEVENRTTAELIEAYIRRVPGVVSVQSELTWRLDDLARRTAASADRKPRKV